MYTEEQLLDPAVRKKLIESFDSQGNLRRKYQAFKAYECLKDKTKNYVLDLLLKKFSLETVQEMQYAISNVSVFRKVIEKLAKVYSNGAKRTIPLEGESQKIADEDTKVVEDLAKFFDMNAIMAKANKYYRAFWNTMLYVYPQIEETGYTIAIGVKAPFLYDVVPNPANPEKPLAVVLSDYVPTREQLFALGDAAVAGRTVGEVRTVQTANDLYDEKGEDKREFVWWTKNFHFTTDAKGEIIAAGNDGDITNPILELPFVNLCGDQDGKFWAEGGEDLVDTGVGINVAITDAEHISSNQGYGQLFMTGKNLPKSVKVGPTHCIQLEHEADDPVPTVGYLEANPPLEMHKALIEMKVALMLTTNNLSTSGFSLSLEGGRDFASGVALMIDKSESNEDVNEQSKIFVQQEPKVWGKIARWHDVYSTRGLLVEELQSVTMPKNIEKMLINFPPVKPLLSEKEHLEVLEKRQSLGFNTRVELLMRDDPSLTEEMAIDRLAKIDAEKAARAEIFGVSDGNKGENGDGVEEQNERNSGADTAGREDKREGQEENPE